VGGACADLARPNSALGQRARCGRTLCRLNE
jgi:hypothetical protein